MKKWNRSLKPPLITIVEFQILNSYKKGFWRKKKKQHYHHYYHHHHHHCQNYCCHYHQFHHNHHSLSAPPGPIPVWGPLGWKKHIIISIVIIVIIIFIIIIIIITIVIVFLPPLVPIVFRSFGSKISHFPFSRLVKIQYKIYFQPRRSASFLKKKEEIIFVFLKTRSVFELLHPYSNLAKVDIIPSSSFFYGSPCSLLEGVFEKTNIACFCPHFGKLHFRAKLYLLYITIGQKDCTYGILGEFLI